MSESERLKEIRKEITEIGLRLLKEKTPLPVSEATQFLTPFAKIEKQIDKIIQNINPQKH